MAEGVSQTEGNIFLPGYDLQPGQVAAVIEIFRALGLGITPVLPEQVANPSAEMLADLDATYRLVVPPYTRFRSTGTQLVDVAGTDSSPVSSVAGKSGDVVLDKSDVGLTQVDNTSDAEKPVSIPQLELIDTKHPRLQIQAGGVNVGTNDATVINFSGTGFVITRVGNTINIDLQIQIPVDALLDENDDPLLAETGDYLTEE